MCKCEFECELIQTKRVCFLLSASRLYSTLHQTKKMCLCPYICIMQMCQEQYRIECIVNFTGIVLTVISHKRSQSLCMRRKKERERLCKPDLDERKMDERIYIHLY